MVRGASIDGKHFGCVPLHSVTKEAISHRVAPGLALVSIRLRERRGE
jgi:hypothetical protein